MKKTTLSWVLLCLTIAPVFSQLYLEGEVLDSLTQEKLSGANILLVETNTGTSTNEFGQFQIEFSKMGQSIIVSHVGYLSQSILLGGENNLQIRLSPKTNLEEIIINSYRASAWEPVSEKTLNKEEIKPILVGQDVQFVLASLTPSIVSYSESGTSFSNYGQFRLRGIDQSRVNITLNGAPLNDMIDQGVFFSNFTDFSNSIQSLQVQRGVGTSANGTASYAGSINFESVKLNDESPSGQLEFVGGSFNTYRASISAKTGILPSKTAFHTQFSTFTSDGYRHHSGTDSYSFYGSGGYFAEKDLLKFTAFIGRSGNGLAYSPVAISDIKNNPKTNYNNENDTDDFGQQFFQLQHTHSFSNNTSMISALYYGGAGGDYLYTYLDENNSFAQINYPLQNNHYGASANIESRLGDLLAFSTGIHGYTFHRVNEEVLIPDNAHPYYVERSNKDEISLFAKAEYAVGDMTIYGDLQYRALSLDINPDDTVLPEEGIITKNWTFVNPRLGITYALDPKQRIYVSYGKTGREPTKIDIFGGFALTSANIESVKSDVVRPEFVNDLEAGLIMAYPKISGHFNGFYMFFRNEIAPIGEYVPEGFLQLRKNIPSSTRTGIELDFEWKVNTHVQLSGNMTYMYSNIEEYKPDEDPTTYYNVKPSLSPEWMGYTALNVELTSWWSINLSGKYISESFQEPTNNELFKMPAFTVADLSTSFHFGKNSSVYIFLNNIFNTMYYTYGAPVDNDWDGVYDEPGYFIQPPRHGYIRLTFGF